MALFSRNKKKTEEAKQAPAAVAMPMIKGDYAHILRNPRITEKASLVMERFTYVFDVAPTANKRQIIAAIQQVYKVKPRKVHVLNVKPKEMRNMRTGKSGMRSGSRKAYVYLNEGETITIA